MKTCLTTLYVFCCALVVLSLSCSKRDIRHAPPDEFYLEARSYFEKSVLPGSQGGTKITADQQLLEKSPDWQEARIQDLPRGRTIVVPLKHKDTTQYATVIGGNFKCKLDKIGYLLLSKDKDFRAEVIYKIPDTARVTEKFSGIVLIETWDGRFLEGYRYRNDSVFKVSTQLIPGGLQTNSWQTVCEEIDWYSCAYSGNSGVYCHYSYTTKHCIDNPDNGGGGTPTGGGVGGAGGGGGTPVYPGRTPADSDPATRPRREPAEPTGKLDICKKSFAFQKVVALDEKGFGGWQIAAVSNVHMNLVDPSSGVLMTVRPGPVLYFGFPIVRSNGTFYSTARAAELAVEIDNKALLDVMAAYHSGRPIDWEGMNVLYRTKLNDYAKQYGGRVTLIPGIGNVTDLPVMPAKYSGIAGIGCL